MSDVSQSGATQSPVSALKDAALFAGEAVIPGGSNLLKGHFVDGLLYAAVGTFARAVLPLPLSALVSASSFTKATTNQHLPQALAKLPIGGNAALIAELRSKVSALEATVAGMTAASPAPAPVSPIPAKK